jgi:histidyl-tRNA synthetase
LLSSLGEESQAHFAALCAALKAANIDYIVDPKLVRGLDYYSGTVFEWITDALGAQGTVCAGGRYDGLVEQLGGPATPGIGWAMGEERIVMLLEKLGLSAAGQSPEVYLVLAGQAAEAAGMRLAETLRDQQADLRVQINLGGGSFKAQFKRADKSGAEYAVILGDDEVARGVASIKALRREAPQEDVPIDQVSERLGSLLGPTKR